MGEDRSLNIAAFTDVFEELKTDLLQFLPELTGAILILIAGVLIAYFLKLSSKIIVKWGLHLLPDFVLEKNLVKSSFEGLVLGVGQFLFLLTIFLAVASSFQKLGFVAGAQLIQNLGKYLPSIIGALLILLLGWKAKELIRDFTRQALNKTEFLYAHAASKILSWSFFTICLLVALEQVGVDISLVIAISTVLVGVLAGGVVLTFALGAKATISDILYCYQLNKYLKIGREIEISGFKGSVKSVGPIFVLVQTEQGEITIPGNVFNREIVKLSHGAGGLDEQR